jgi:hypothetical protein
VTIVLAAEQIVTHLQLQKSQVCVGIDGAVLALLGDIFLEDTGGLGVIAIEAVQYRIDMFGPVRSEVEGNAHLDCFGDLGRRIRKLFCRGVKNCDVQFGRGKWWVLGWLPRSCHVIYLDIFPVWEVAMKVDSNL